jgi:hypothetical protein
MIFKTHKIKIGIPSIAPTAHISDSVTAHNLNNSPFFPLVTLLNALSAEFVLVLSKSVWLYLVPCSSSCLKKKKRFKNID